MRENDPHTNRRMPKAVDRPLGLQNGIHLQSGLIQQRIELPREDARSSCPVLVVREEQVILSPRVWVALAQALVRGDSTFKRVRNAQMKPLGPRWSLSPFRPWLETRQGE